MSAALLRIDPVWDAVRSDQAFVALTKDYGFPDTMLYRGWNEALMRDIAKTVRDVGGLPCTGT